MLFNINMMSLFIDIIHYIVCLFLISIKKFDSQRFLCKSNEFNGKIELAYCKKQLFDFFKKISGFHNFTKNQMVPNITNEVWQPPAKFNRYLWMKLHVHQQA